MMGNAIFLCPALNRTTKELVLLEISRYVKAFYSTVRTLFEILDSSSNS